MPQWQNKFATNHCTKEQRDPSLNSGTAPIHPSFVLQTPPSSCHVQYLIGILTLQITQHLLLGCILETLCSLQAEFKGLSLLIDKIHACHCGRTSRSWTETKLLQASMKNWATSIFETQSYSTDVKLWMVGGQGSELTNEENLFEKQLKGC